MDLVILGCGSMGTAILTGLLHNQDSNKSELVINITACVSSEASAQRLSSKFRNQTDRVRVVHGRGNYDAVSLADVVVLAFKPYMLQKVLGDRGMQSAIMDKKLISVLGGISHDNVREALNFTSVDLVCAIPNLGAEVGESMTVISDPHNASADLVSLTTCLFERIGRVAIIPEATFSVAMVLSGAGLAFTSVAVDGLLDGAVAGGLPRPLGMKVVAQCLRGLAALLEEGRHPAQLREAISSPAGTTIQGLITLERGSVRGWFADALVSGSEHSKSMAARQD